MMVRHEAIADLSRDHHKALVQALAMKRADERTAASVAADFVTFFDDHGNRHFEIEEQVLLPLYAEFAGSGVVEDAAVARVLREHVVLRARVAVLRSGDAEAGYVNETGELLDAHIRHEERQLFGQIERALTDEQLARLGSAVRAAEER